MCVHIHPGRLAPLGAEVDESLGPRIVGAPRMMMKTPLVSADLWHTESSESKLCACLFVPGIRQSASELSLPMQRSLFEP